MKLNLLLNAPGDVRSGYVNVDNFVPDDDTTRVRGDVFNLAAIADAGEIEELVAHEILDYAPGCDVDRVLNHWVSLVAHGGLISLATIDVMEVARALHGRHLSLDDADVLLHGEQRELWQCRKASFSLNRLAAVLEAKGLKILKKRNDNYRAYVVAQRP